MKDVSTRGGDLHAAVDLGADAVATAAVGSALPELHIPVDRSLIVAAAIASQDFEDVHHDPGAAQSRGMKDIFMSINSTNGLLDRYITDWTGPTYRIVKVALRLGVPQFPGDDLVFTGQVVARDEEGVSVKVEGSNPGGVHVRAQLTVRPRREVLP